uniref:Transmembrane protein n=1 Tax=Chromera velia CCMP2878 TaxID=1169474 RepID=A0A0G4HXT5_9ALVE|eukprot:Cvel_9340.t1-p1 / transcript=Cvel_9340.t1 / gene=Cvel_9340 / organism=Chromera_velia_CCMP2878 / gene_product=hypothetical protein / transcript_product=hypothetical protein / location=Cvel_scaffold536:32261-37476(+) / protein_length=967 / sequence_SO=supercontig / SO=protein_coding / is_pseudo=false
MASLLPLPSGHPSNSPSAGKAGSSNSRASPRGGADSAGGGRDGSAEKADVPPSAQGLLGALKVRSRTAAPPSPTPTSASPSSHFLSLGGDSVKRRSREGGGGGSLLFFVFVFLCLALLVFLLSRTSSLLPSSAGPQDKIAVNLRGQPARNVGGRGPQEVEPPAKVAEVQATATLQVDKPVSKGEERGGASLSVAPAGDGGTPPLDFVSSPGGALFDPQRGVSIPPEVSSPPPSLQDPVTLPPGLRESERQTGVQRQEEREETEHQERTPKKTPEEEGEGDGSEKNTEQKASYRRSSAEQPSSSSASAAAASEGHEEPSTQAQVPRLSEEADVVELKKEKKENEESARTEEALLAHKEKTESAEGQGETQNDKGEEVPSAEQIPPTAESPTEEKTKGEEDSGGETLNSPRSLPDISMHAKSDDAATGSQRLPAIAEAKQEKTEAKAEEEKEPKTDTEKDKGEEGKDDTKGAEESDKTVISPQKSVTEAEKERPNNVEAEETNKPKDAEETAVTEKEDDVHEAEERPREGAGAATQGAEGEEKVESGPPSLLPQALEAGHGESTASVRVGPVRMSGYEASKDLYESDDLHDPLNAPKLFDSSLLSPLTAEFQEFIYKNQHPASCAEAQYIISNIAPSGFGSEMHQFGAVLGNALRMGRVFVYHAGAGSSWVGNSPSFCGKSKGLDCLFRPVSNCTLDDAMKSKDPHRQKLIGKDMTNPRRMIPEEWQEKLSKVWPRMGNEEMKYWIRGQSVSYLLRLNSKTREELRKLRASEGDQLQRLVGGVKVSKGKSEFKGKGDPPAPPDLYYPLPRGSVGVHIRRGDKLIREMKLVPAETFFSLSESLVRRQPNSLRRVLFLSFDDAQIWADVKKDAESGSLQEWDVVYSEIPREEKWSYSTARAYDTSSKQTGGERVQLMLRHLLQLMMQLEVDAWVGTRKSNWNRMVDELRCVWVPKCPNPYVDAHGYEYYDW